MSLINQVLKDLEQRRADDTAQAPITEDLVFRTDLDDRRQPVVSRTRGLVMGLAVLLLGGGGYAGWWYWQDHNATAGHATNDVPAKGSADTVSSPVVNAGPRRDEPLERSEQQPAAQPQRAERPTDVVAVTEPVAAKSNEPATASKLTSKTNDAHAPQPTVNQSEEHTSDVSPPTPVETVAKREEANATMAVAQEPATPLTKRRVPLNPAQKAELAYQRAFRAVQTGNHLRAEALLQKALAADPAHAQARALLAGSLIQNGRWANAASVLEQGIALDPANLAFRKLYARASMQLGQDQQAIDTLRDGAPSVSEDPQYHALLAAVYQRTQQHSDAVGVYLQVLKARPHRGDWWVGLGISLEALDKHRQAQQAYQKARHNGNLAKDLERYAAHRLLALEALGIASE